MALRTTVTWFNVPNPVNAGAQVYVYAAPANEDDLSNPTLITLYENIFGADEFPNPFYLNSMGMSERPFYFEEDAYAQIVNSLAGDYTTGVVRVENLVTIQDSVTIDVPGDYPTVAQAYASVADAIIPDDVTVTIRVTGKVSDASIANIQTPYAHRIAIEGAAPLSKTIMASGHTVTGSAGNYQVTLNLNNTTGMSVGDIVVLGRNRLTNAYNTLKRGFVYVLADPGRLTTVGTTATLSGAVGTSVLAVGMHIIYRGEMRQIVSITNATTFVIDSAFSVDVTSVVEWFYLNKASGTISTSGSSTTITGSGTDFTSRCGVGDIVFVAVNGECYTPRITAVNSDTSLTVDKAINIASPTDFGIHSTTLLHEGAFRVTAVSGNTVTYTNTNRVDAAYAQPHANALRGGTAIVLTSVLNVTGNSDGLVCSGDKGLMRFKDLGLYSTTAQNGITTDVGYRYGLASINCEGQVAVVGFSVGIRTYHGVVNADSIVVSGCTSAYGLFVDKGKIDAEDMVVSGCSSIGCFLGPSAGARISDAMAVGNGGNGWYGLGSAIYGDRVAAMANGHTQGLHGFFLTSGVALSQVQSESCWNGGGGFSIIRGGGGRVPGGLALANATFGLSASLCSLSIPGFFAAGNGTEGILFGESAFLEGDDAASNFNGNRGFLATLRAGGNLDRFRAFGNKGRGILVQEGADIIMPNCLSKSNTTADYTCNNAGSRLRINGVLSGTPSSVFASPVNATSSTGGVISNNSQAQVQPDNPMRFSTTWNIANLTTLTSATTTVTCTGVRVADHKIVRVDPPTVGTGNAVLVTGIVTADNEVTLTARNISGSDSDPASTSFIISVSGATV